MTIISQNNKNLFKQVGKARAWKITLSFCTGVAAKTMFPQRVDVTSHESEFVASKMIKVVPCIYASFMQVIKKQPKMDMVGYH